MRGVQEAMDEFNRHHGAEAHVKTAGYGYELTMRFSGAMCHTCGHHEYFEDLRILLEDHGITTAVGTVTEQEGSTVVEFLRT